MRLLPVIHLVLLMHLLRTGSRYLMVVTLLMSLSSLEGAAEMQGQILVRAGLPTPHLASRNSHIYC